MYFRVRAISVFEIKNTKSSHVRKELEKAIKSVISDNLLNLELKDLEL